MAKKAKWANILTGGGAGALDKIDGADLADLDMAIVVTASVVYIYSLDADSAAAESSPDIISPDTNAGDKRWILVSATLKNLVLQSVVNAGTDTDKFLVLDASKNVDFRTGAEVLSDIGAEASGVSVLENDFDATTFLYATADNTPQPKTPAQVMAILSGQAGAAFDFNSQNLTGVGVFQGSNIRIGTNQIANTLSDSDSVDIWINYYGYNNGVTRYRDFRIGDGKSVLMLFADGSAGTIDFSQHDASTKGLKLGGTLVTASAAEINSTLDGILATYAEINTVADGATAKNSHTHDGRYYTETELDAALALKAALTVFSPISVPPAAFVPKYDTFDWDIQNICVKNRSSLTEQLFFAPVIFPINGVTISKLTFYGHRDDASSSMELRMMRISAGGSSSTMATVDADWTSGPSSGYDDSISNAVIDNDSYSYGLQLLLNPNDNVNDCSFERAKIEFS